MVRAIVLIGLLMGGSIASPMKAIAQLPEICPCGCGTKFAACKMVKCTVKEKLIAQEQAALNLWREMATARAKAAVEKAKADLRDALADAKRADRARVQEAEEQLKKENKRAAIIDSIVEALKTKPGDAGPKALEESVKFVLQRMGLDSTEKLQRAAEEKADARRLADIILELEKKDRPGSRNK